jgi:tetratricopeptide (TPR) repeat protein
MNRRIGWFTMVLLAVPALCLAVQKEKEKVTTEHKVKTTTLTEPTGTEGWVCVEEDVWLTLADETDDHFIEAQESLNSKDYPDAAEELREAAAFLRVEARRTSDKARAELYDSAKELETLAQRVEKGEIKSAEELDAPFARAAEALGRHYHARADYYWKAKQHERAGKALDAATDAIDNSMRWSKQKADAAWDRTKETTRKVTAKLAQGTEWAANEVDEAFEATSRELKNLARKIRTVRDEPPRDEK